MSPFSPSVSAIILPFTPAAAVAFIAKGMVAEGHKPTRTHIPKNLHTFPGESVEFKVFSMPDSAGPTPMALAVPSDPSRVFHLAVEISKGSPDIVFTAWRRFSGFDPVAKVFFGGKPQWKDAEDPDHEVFYAVPRQAPAELRVPGPVVIPTSGEVIERICAALVTDAHGAQPNIAGMLRSTWLNRQSRRQPV